MSHTIMEHQHTTHYSHFNRAGFAFHPTVFLTFSGLIADRVNLRYFLTIGMIGESYITLVRSETVLQEAALIKESSATYENP